MKTRAQVALLLIGCLFLPAAVCARSSSGGYSVRIENEWGRELPTYSHRGQTFVMGALGERYTIRVRNQTATRVEAVVTVDGRDVVSGNEGDFVGERGYIIDGYDEVVIEGFRKSFDAVAAFRFSSPGESYSSRRGTPQNVGVIGVAVFPERARPRPRPAPKPIARPRDEERQLNPYSRNHGHGGGSGRGLGTSYGEGAADAQASAAPRPTAEARKARSAPQPASAPRAMDDLMDGALGGYRSGDAYEAERPAPEETDNLGTEYGESVGSAAREVAFVRADSRHPAALLTVRYDDAEGLQARGIQIYPSRPIARATPDPFPRNRFAPPPN